MEQVYAAWDYIITNWQVIALVIVPFLSTLVLKLGRIGWLLNQVLARVKDGSLSVQEKADTFDDVISVFRGWLPNRSKKE
ncbi:MAG: hypothetical protein C4542_08230 [Dehalococcoidia bacterium]|nr:MAG: hypothetical protein C4542_08230 [Dehalococcoidia bacterium]